MNSTTTYFISVALSDYDSLPDLDYATHDSNCLQKILEKKYQIKTFRFLHDQNATAAAINNTFSELKDKIQSGDSLIFFFNGHGVFHENASYFQVHASEEKHPETWYAFSELMQRINALNPFKLKHVAIWINACHMGKAVKDAYSKVDSEWIDKARIVLSAGSDTQHVYHYHDVEAFKGNSPFTGSLLKALENNGSVKISMNEIAQDVKKLFETHNLGSTPRYSQLDGDDGNDFYLSLAFSENEFWEKTCATDTIAAYEEYQELFPYSDDNNNTAKHRIEALKNENKYWLACNQKLKDMLKIYVNQFAQVPNSKFMKDAKHILTQCDKIIEELEYSDITASENAWKSLDLPDSDATKKEMQDAIDRLHAFARANDISEAFKRKAKERIANYEIRLNELELWDQFKDKRKTPEQRFNLGFRYKEQHPQGRNLRFVNRKQIDIEKWLKISNSKETDIQVRLNEIDKYLELSEAECTKDANKLRGKLEERLKLQETLMRCEAEVYQAIGNLNKMYDIKLNLEQISEDLKPEYEPIIKLVNEDMETLTQEVDQEYDKVLKQQNIAEMYKFYKQYEDIKLENLKAQLETVKLKLDEIDDKWFNDAEISKLPADYEKYIEIFGQINEFRTQKASDRIEEIQFYEGLKSKEDFEAYREQYQEDGLFMPEVTEKLAVLNVAEQKRIAKEDFAAKLNSETFEIFQRLLIGDEDDETMKLLEKGKEIQRQKAADEALQFLLECQNDTKLQLKLCEQYNNKFPNTNHSDVVNEIRLQIIDLKDNDAFNDAETENSIPAWDKYLNNGLDKSPKREKQAQERKKILEDIETEKQDFEVAQKSKEGCVIYIGKYGEKGKFYEEVAQSFAKWQLNIKDEDKQISGDFTKTHEAIANLSGSIQQWTESQAVQYKSQQKVLLDKLDALKTDHSATAIESQHQPLLDKLEDLKVSNIATTEKLVAKIVEGFKEETTANSNGFQGQMKEDFKSVSDKQAQTNHNINDLTLSIKELVGKLDVHLTQQTVHFKDNLEQQEAIQKSLNALPNAVGKGFTESLDKSLQTKEKDAQNEVKLLTEAVLSMVSSNADKAKATKNEMTEQVKEIKDNFDEKEQKIGKMFHAMDDDQKEMKNIFAEHQKDLLNVFKDIRDGLLRSEKQSGENYQELAKSFKDFTAKQQESIDASKKESKENQQELSKTFKEFTNKQQESIEQEESNQKALSKIFNEVTNEQRESIKRFEKHEKENHQALLDALNGFTSKQDEVIQSAEGNQQKLLGAFRTFANSSEKQSETQLEKISAEMKLNAKNQTVTIIVRLLTIIVLGYFIYWIYQNFFMHKVNAFL